jgi:hypothetical protein
MAKPISILLGILACGYSLSAAQACGDKLLALGGGVSYERVFSSRHPGNLILLLRPESALTAANDRLRLDNALQRAGHKVRTVNSRTELESSLREAAADLIVTDWEDARALAPEVAARVAILPVVSGPEKTPKAGSASGTDCLVDVNRHKGRQMIRAVDQLLERGEKGLPANCLKHELAAS